MISAHRSNPAPLMGQNEPVPSLLLIEDDDAIRTALESLTTRQGHRVATAASGEDGLKLLREQRPDLIVLDVMLPGIDGFEVCRRIRRTDQLPIILLTARNDDIDVVVGLESGADDYVVKPVQGRVLDARIRAVLRRGERESNDAGVVRQPRHRPLGDDRDQERRGPPAHADRAAAAAGAEPSAGAGAVPAAAAAAGVGARLPG
ncbi:Regulator of RpoS [Streptomyces purpurascens]